MFTLLTVYSSVTLHATFLTENTEVVVFECSDHIEWNIIFVYLFIFSSNTFLNLTVCKLEFREILTVVHFIF
jgi:hypothetical protein